MAEIHPSGSHRSQYFQRSWQKEQPAFEARIPLPVARPLPPVRDMLHSSDVGIIGVSELGSRSSDFVVFMSFEVRKVGTTWTL